MMHSLRKLLVALAAVSTVLVGVRLSAAASEAAVSAAWTIDDAQDGPREDGSDARSEQAEEDDSEEEDGRHLHLLATAALSCSLNGRITSVTRDTCPRARRSQRSSALVRGPPTSF